MKKIIFTLIALIFLFSFAFSVNATIVSTCQNINSAGYYQLNQIVNCSGICNSDCFVINSNNVILDGNGFILNYDLYFGENKGIKINGSYNNITIENFTDISSDNDNLGESYAVYSESPISNLNMFNNGIGINTGLGEGVFMGDTTINSLFVNDNFSVGNPSLAVYGSMTNDSFHSCNGNVLRLGDNSSNVYFLDSLFSSYLFFGNENDNVTFENSSYGKVNFNKIGNDFFINLPVINNNFIMLGTFNPIANETAEVTFYNVGLSSPEVIRNGVTCNFSFCSVLFNNGNDYYFDINEGGNYSLQNPPSPPSALITTFAIFDEAGAGLGIFIQYLGIALPPLLFGLALVLVVVMVGWGVAEMLYKFANRNICK